MWGDKAPGGLGYLSFFPFSPYLPVPATCIHTHISLLSRASPSCRRTPHSPHPPKALDPPAGALVKKMYSILIGFLFIFLYLSLIKKKDFNLFKMSSQKHSMLDYPPPAPRPGPPREIMLIYYMCYYCQAACQASCRSRLAGHHAVPSRSFLALVP